MHKLQFSAASLVIALMLAGCNSSNNNPTPAPSPANISGDYTGTMVDSQSGNGTASAVLAQHGSTAGGAITDQEASATVTAQISLGITSSNALSGAMVIDFANGTTCSFSTTGTYDPTNAVITGSYTAVTNCTGETGTYTLNQQCTDTVTSADRRPMALPPHC